MNCDSSFINILCIRCMFSQSVHWAEELTQCVIIRQHLSERKSQLKNEADRWKSERTRKSKYLVREVQRWELRNHANWMMCRVFFFFSFFFSKLEKVVWPRASEQIVRKRKMWCRVIKFCRSNIIHTQVSRDQTVFINQT